MVVFCQRFGNAHHHEQGHQLVTYLVRQVEEIHPLVREYAGHKVRVSIKGKTSGLISWPRITALALATIML